MAVPRKYRRSQEQILASFDFSDIAEGKAYTRYYLTDVNIATTTTPVTDYNITKNVIHGDEGQTLKTSGSSFALTFDLDFGKTRRIDGDILVSIPLMYQASTGSVAYDIDWYTDIYHVNSSGTETRIGARKVRNVTDSSVGTTGENKRFTVLVESGGVQIFRNGEKLRVEIISNPNDLTPTNSNTAVGHDPANRSTFGGVGTRNWSENGSQAYIDLPIVIDN